MQNHLFHTIFFWSFCPIVIMLCPIISLLSAFVLSLCRNVLKLSAIESLLVALFTFVMDRCHHIVSNRQFVMCIFLIGMCKYIIQCQILCLLCALFSLFWASVIIFVLNVKCIWFFILTVMYKRSCVTSNTKYVKHIHILLSVNVIVLSQNVSLLGTFFTSLCSNAIVLCTIVRLLGAGFMLRRNKYILQGGAFFPIQFFKLLFLQNHWANLNKPLLMPV